MKVVLPDENELELPDGATGLDAARAIGPKLAEQAVLVRVERRRAGPARAARTTASRSRSSPSRDKDDPDALYVLRHSSAHLLAEAVRRLYPGVKVAIGPPIDNGFYYDFDFPEPITEADLERIEAEVEARDRRGPRVEPRGDDAPTTRARASTPRASRTRSSSSTRPRARSASTPRATNGTAEFTDLCRGPHLQNSGADQGAQAHGPRGRVLARRREEHAADPHLRHRLLHARPTSTRTSSGSRRHARATTAGSASSSTSSTSPTSRPARRSGTRRAW